MKLINHSPISFPEDCCIFPRLIANKDSKIPPTIKNTQLIFIVSYLINYLTASHKKSIPLFRTSAYAKKGYARLYSSGDEYSCSFKSTKIQKLRILAILTPNLDEWGNLVRDHSQFAGGHRSLAASPRRGNNADHSILFSKGFQGVENYIQWFFIQWTKPFVKKKKFWLDCVMCCMLSAKANARREKLETFAPESVFTFLTFPR